MARIEIKPTALPDGTEGDCGYINVSEETAIFTNRTFEQGKEYTLSFMAKADTDKIITFLNGFNKTDITSEISTDWNKVKITFTSLGTIVGVSIPSGEYYLYQAQVTEGDISTVWQPSLGDRDNEKHEIETKIEIQNGKIEQSIKKDTSYNGMTISDSGVEFIGDGCFVVNMSNLQIDEEGHITIKGAKIIDGSIELNQETRTGSMQHVLVRYYRKPTSTDTGVEISSLLDANELSIKRKIYLRGMTVEDVEAVLRPDNLVFESYDVNGELLYRRTFMGLYQSYNKSRAFGQAYASEDIELVQSVKTKVNLDSEMGLVDFELENGGLKCPYGGYVEVVLSAYFNPRKGYCGVMVDNGVDAEYLMYYEPAGNPQEGSITASRIIHVNAGEILYMSAESNTRGDVIKGNNSLYANERSTNMSVKYISIDYVQ